MRIGSLSPRRLSLALIFATSLVFGTFIVASPAAPASALTNCTVSDMTVDAQELAFLTLINSYRAANGKAALTINTNLTRAASLHSGDMATKNYFSHTDSWGRSPSLRVANCDGPSGIGENIAAGTSWDTAQEVFDGWKKSAGHNANMLNENYKQIGIARHYTSTSQYKWYWTTDFSTSTSSGGSSPSQTASSMTSPTPGSLLGNSATFNWSAASGASQYRLYVGTTPGSSNLKSLTTTSRSTTVTNLAPTTGTRTVYVRLGTRFGTSSTWYYRDYVYTARR